MRKSRQWMLFIAGALLVYHFDVITGSLKFHRMCKNEGGPRFYGPVEKDAGWEVEGHDTYEYQRPFPFGHIAFVRYQDKAGVRSDVRFAGYKQITPTHAEPNYVFSPVNEAVPVRYKFQHLYEAFPGDDRFSKSLDQVIDLEAGKVVATYTKFGFQWTKPERVVLAASTSNGCWNGSDPGEDIDSFHKNIYRFGSK